MTSAATSIPTTASQRLIWLGQALAPDLPLYEEPCTFMLSGKIDEGAFAEAFNNLVRCADSMRLQLDDTGEALRLVREVPRACEIVDLSDRPDQLRAWIKARMQQKMDAASCLYDSALLRLGPESYCWYLNVHHLITDGWNMRVLFRLQYACYDACRTGASMPDVASFQDYATFEAERVSRPEWPSFTEWFQQRMPESDSVNPHLYAHSSPEADAACHTRVTVDMTPQLSQQLFELAARAPFRSLTPELGLAHVLLTALFAWVYRIQDTHTLCLGMTSHGRSSRKFRETPGLFMQQLPLHLSLDDGETFASLAEKVVRENMAVLNHAVPGVGSIALQKSFAVLLNYIPAVFGPFGETPAEMQWHHNGWGDTGRTLGVTVHDFNATGTLHFLFDFNNARFDADARDNAVRHYFATLQSVCANPDTPITRYPLLDVWEERWITRRLTGRQTQLPRTSLWAKVEKAAMQQADNIAIRDSSGREVTWLDVLQRAGDLAQRLQQQGVTSGAMVPIVARRDAPMVIAILGVLKAGAAFVPVDPDLPEARQAWIIDDVRTDVVIRQNPDGTLVLDPLEHSNPRRGGSTGITYVLYTSGSTGSPNGVMVPDSALQNMLASVESLAPLEVNAPCAWWTNVGFDVAVYEVFTALAYGRTLVIPDEETRLDDTAYFAFLGAEAVACAYMPAAFLPRFLRWVDAGGTVALQRLLVGVEPIPQTLLAALQKRIAGLVIVNGYGPTEATICVTLHGVDSTATGPGPAPIGLPVDNTSVQVLDRHGNLVPRGVTGELWVSGRAVAQGYLDRPELTAARFSFAAAQPDSGSFRTGDLARLNSNGQLVFAGRVDDQVKLKGERVEPGEVTATALGLADVVECVVGLANLTGQPQLVLYYVGEQACTPAHLREHLREHLPKNMIPRSIMQVSQIPRNRNGKPVFEQLPPPDSVAPVFKAPQTETEAAILEVWRELLGHPEMGVEDDFVDLGGDSLMAVRLINRVNALFDIDLSVSEAFTHGTVSRFALLVESQVLADIQAMSAAEVARMLAEDNS